MTTVFDENDLDDLEFEMSELTEEERERVRSLSREIRGKRTYLEMENLTDGNAMGRETWRATLENSGRFTRDEQREKLARLAGWTVDELKEYLQTGLRPHEIPFEVKRERLMKKLMDFTPEERLAITKELLSSVEI